MIETINTMTVSVRVRVRDFNSMVYLLRLSSANREPKLNRHAQDMNGNVSYKTWMKSIGNLEILTLTLCLTLALPPALTLTPT